MSVQDLVSGQLRLIKVGYSRISELRPGTQVFVLQAVSAQRKISGQFHIVKSAQADAVGSIEAFIQSGFILNHYIDFVHQVVLSRPDLRLSQVELMAPEGKGVSYYALFFVFFCN